MLVLVLAASVLRADSEGDATGGGWAEVLAARLSGGDVAAPQPASMELTSTTCSNMPIALREEFIVMPRHPTAGTRRPS